MNETGQWVVAVAPLRQALEAGQDPQRRRELRGLYALAEAQGARLLAKYHQLDEETRRDLVLDLLARSDKLRAIIAAESPRAFFVQCVTRAAIDALRRQKTRARPVEPEVFDQQPVDAAADQDFVLDARAVLEALPPRTREIVVAVHSGVDRDEVAAQFGVGRPAIDKVVSRVQRKWKEGDGP